MTSASDQTGKDPSRPRPDSSGSAPAPTTNHGSRRHPHASRGRETVGGSEAQRSGHSGGRHDEREPIKPRSRLRRPLVAGGLFLLVLVLLLGGTFFWLHGRTYESTEDAVIDVEPQRVSAQLPGRVLRVLAQDNQEVAVDTVLVELDSADYQAKIQQARAAGAQALAQADQARAQHAVFAAQLEEARAHLTAAETTAENAGKDLERLNRLKAENSGAVAQQQWDSASAGQRNAAAQVDAAKQGVAAVDAQLGYADSLLKAADAMRASAEAQVREAELNLSYMQVKARVAGRVANLHVAPGNYIQPGMPLMAVVPREVSITANFKETQLRDMRRGQPVEITVDAYPDMELRGHIDSFQPGTGQTFSAIPAENATGNWVKVVQRVPVKIVLDQVPNDPDRWLGPGMSVEAKVTVR
jgi:membrane fusion protein (multidrug efflux system)